MDAVESLRNLTVPAHGLERGKNIRQLFWPEVFPLCRSPVRSQQGWGMIDAMHRSELLVTKDTFLPLIPVGDDVPDQTILRIGFHLLQAFMAAVLPFRPA